jgi:uracil-DNA glycosylase
MTSIVPHIVLDARKILAVMISEAAPENPDDNYYSGEDSLFQKTTVQAFQDAGAHVKSISDIQDIGFYFTTAVKCGKTGYGIKAPTIRQCSFLLEEELSQFPNIKVYMLMGDVAIRAFNYITKRSDNKRVIPAGSTYKIRKTMYFHNDKRVFPSYTQAGPSFFIEKSKRRMIAEDIAAALELVSQ